MSFLFHIANYGILCVALSHKMLLNTHWDQKKCEKDLGLCLLLQDNVSVELHIS